MPLQNNSIPDVPTRTSSSSLVEELKSVISNAIRFWEIRRIYYNLTLALIVVFNFLAYGGRIGSGIFLDLFGLFLLAVIANVLFCAAYPVDVFVQMSHYRELWRRYRWVLFLLGTAFASIWASILSHNIGHGN